MRFLRFAVVGVGNTAVAWFVFNVLAVGLHVAPLWANAAGWLAAFANSYFWNRRWTFSDRRELAARRVLPRFAVTNLVALGASTLVIAVLQRTITAAEGQRLSALQLNGIEAAAIAVSLTLNYALSSRWAFH